MSVIVTRTCTELDQHGGPVCPGRTRVLSDFRSRSAIVLLGDPGAGKTTEFLKEQVALSSEAAYIRARDFVTLDLDSCPEWRGRALYIDGLDEIRAGATDGRVPLDEIRYRLGRLKPRRFRISCREADWLGPNDRQSLLEASPDRRVTVLQLDPLDEDSIRQILRSRVPSDVEGFVDEARSLGIWPLMENPLTLRLLLDSRRQGVGLPRGRRETFEIACDKLVTEVNIEHAVVSAPASVRIVAAAGYLCALHLLAGIEGYSLHRLLDDSSYMPIDELYELPPGVSLVDLRHAVRTRLFTAESETVFRPIHRQVAEFLAGRYLARLVDEGLPARRVVALMTGPSDGGVVTELRGLSAWLAAYSPEARPLLIEADPVGTGLYGDVSEFTHDEKVILLRSLARWSGRGSLYGHGWRDQRDAGYWDDTAWAFRSLASADMVPTIEALIASEGRGSTSHRLMAFVLEVVSKAERREVVDLAGLAPALHGIVYDTEIPYRVRESALDAYLHVAPQSDAKTKALVDLLEAIRKRGYPDPDDQLRGALLEYLYPDAVSPGEVWRYAVPRNNRWYFGKFWNFWSRAMIEQSSPEDLAASLDTLYEDSSGIVQLLQDAGLEELPVHLLARTLEVAGDGADLSDLYRWLRAAAPPRGWRYTYEQNVSYVRKWLEARPGIQKKMVLLWLALEDRAHTFVLLRRRFGDVMHGSSLPPDFGVWCLDAAISLSASDLALSKKLLREAYHCLQTPSISDGLTLEHMQLRVREHSGLAHYLQELLEETRRRSDTLLTEEAEHEKEIRLLRAKQFEEEQREREDWANHLRLQEAQLLANTFAPANLHTLALVYLGQIRAADHRLPENRIIDFIGGDSKLVDAVLTALQRAVWRDDLPRVEDTIELYCNLQKPYLTNPVLISMASLVDSPDVVQGLDTTRKRRALAIYYLFGHDVDGARACHDEWFEQDPSLVLDVLHRCATAAIRNGKELIPGVSDLYRVADHDRLVHEARLKLLATYPTRVPKRQMRQFDSTLGKALHHPDGARLMNLADMKLALKSLSVGQKVRWMTVRAVLSPQRTSKDLADLQTYVGANERRVRNLVEFLHNNSRHLDGVSFVSERRDAELLACLVGLLGRPYVHQELEGVGDLTVDVGASGLIVGWIRELGLMADQEARGGLARLRDDPSLAAWRAHLTHAWETQRIVYRDASYRPPDLGKVQRTLGGRQPANVADLTALLSDCLDDISDRLRGDSANPWRQFWNEGRHGRLDKSKPENSCRDALLAALKGNLPTGVDATPEGHYAAGRRSDIRVSYDGFNVPIEIKKNSHHDLWSGVRTQLIDLYTTDPATSGYGIYLVLWFGARETTRPPRGDRPTTPERLKQRLEEGLTPEEARKISVIVMDVTKPAD